MLRRVALGFGTVVVLAALFAIATPWLLSSDIVKERISARIEELTGLSTTLKGAPKLTLIPFLGIKLKDVVVANPPELAKLYGDEPFVSMNSLEGRLKLLPAMFGRPEIADLKLVRPQFNLRINREGKANWESSEGVLATLFSIATKHLGENANSTIGSLNDVAPVRLGNFEILNGVVNYQNDQTGKTAEITSLNMALSWPTSNVAATANGSAVWQGEIVKFFGNIDKPMRLFAKNSANVTLRISSELLNTRFSGSVEFIHSPQFSGRIEASSPSVRQLLRWIGYDLAPGSTPGELNLASDLAVIGTSFKFQNATISLDGNSGSGFIDMTTAKNKSVKFVGTLAFDTLDFNPYFEALDANNGNIQTRPEIAEIELIKEFDLDLRFSAKTGILGDITMSSIAATAQINKGNVIIDIGEADMFGGLVQAQLQAKEENNTPAGELKLNLIDIDLEELGRFFSPVGIKIIGKGTAAILLKSNGRSVSQIIQRLNGSTAISAAEGRIEGLDFAKIATEGSTAIILDTREVLAKSTEFTNLKIGLHIANGIALFENTSLEGERLRAVIGGKADLWRKSLAINGRVLLFTSDEINGDEIRPVDLDIPFFVGGTLDAPLFAPDLLSPKSKSFENSSREFIFQDKRPKPQSNSNALN